MTCLSRSAKRSYSSSRGLRLPAELRTTIIPTIAIPVSLVATMVVMEMLGFSLNMLSLLGMVLAIGLVVDDAIVVVENVERQLEAGLKPLAATKAAMAEVNRPDPRHHGGC